MSAGERRGQILDAAADLITSQGMDSVTMESAAEAAGVSKALVYRHFDDRDDLMVAVLSREIARLEEATDAAVERSTGFREQIRAALPTFFEHARRGDGLIESLLRATHPSAPLRKLRAGFVEAAESYWASQGARDFDLPRRTALVAAALFLGGLPQLGDLMKRRRIPQEEVERVFGELVVGGLERLRDSSGRRSRRR